MTRIARIGRDRNRGEPISMVRPAPGEYRAKQGGVWVPALIWYSPARDPETGQAMDRAPSLLCKIDGVEVNVWDVWGSLHPVLKKEYLRLCAEREWEPV